ncbi:MAG: hypothetical protein H0T48_06405 [Gemmatimonadaceae bacterium]|nr:hypothetical protein [Gemmatimonadaceae bacterium]
MTTHPAAPTVSSAKSRSLHVSTIRREVGISSDLIDQAAQLINQGGTRRWQMKEIVGRLAVAAKAAPSLDRPRLEPDC